MRILLVGANQRNSTDGLIVEGVRRLLHTKYEVNGREVWTNDYIFINDHAPMGDRDFRPTDQFDLIVYCGTPFISDQIHNSHKWKNVEQLRSIHSYAPFVFMGIGSSVHLKDMNSAFLRDQSHQQAFKKFFGSAAACIVREHFALQVLKDAGVEATQLPCPAYYVPVTQDCNKKGPAMVFYDPRRGISQGDWSNEQKFIKYASEYRDYNYNRDPDVYVANVDDLDGAREIGLPTPKLLSTPEDVYKMIKEATFLLTGRVHNAIPAHANDVLTILMAVDSRAYTFFDYGGAVLFPGNPEMQVKLPPPNWKEEGLKGYLALLPEVPA